VQRAADHLVVHGADRLPDAHGLGAQRSASCGSPSSSSAQMPARAASHACSGASGTPSSSRRARCSQPLATACSPRNAAVSHASHTASAPRQRRRALAIAAVGALARRRRPRRPDRATTRRAQPSSASGCSRSSRATASNACRPRPTRRARARPCGRAVQRLRSIGAAMRAPWEDSWTTTMVRLEARGSPWYALRRDDVRSSRACATHSGRIDSCGRAPIVVDCCRARTRWRRPPPAAEDLGP
jgi:hypothetical protein